MSRAEVNRFLTYAIEELLVAQRSVANAGLVRASHETTYGDFDFNGWVDKASACMSAANVHLGRAKSARQSSTPEPKEE